MQKRGFARVNAFLAVDYGSIDTDFTFEGARRRVPDGIAHYLEHKMFDLPEGNAGNRFSESGAYSNAFTSYGMTAYYFSCTEETEQNLRLLLRMVLTPYFTAESVERSAASSSRRSACMRTAPIPARARLNRCLRVAPAARADRRDGREHRRHHAGAVHALPPRVLSAREHDALRGRRR